MKRVILIGPRGSGKSWMRKYILNNEDMKQNVKFQTKETELQKFPLKIDNIVNLEIWDVPGQELELSLEDWKLVGAIIYVLDAQEDLRERSIRDMNFFFRQARKANSTIDLNVFVNKVDGDPFASEDSRLDVQFAFQKLIANEFDYSTGDESSNTINVRDVSLHLTSVYSQSIFEAFSLVVQKLIPHAYIQRMLDSLIEACNMEKAFLFDSITKITIATDHNPVDPQNLMLCGDSLDLLQDFEKAYSSSSGGGNTATTAVISMSHEILLYSAKFGQRLNLICILKKDAYQKPWLTDYNVAKFQQSLALF